MRFAILVLACSVALSATGSSSPPHQASPPPPPAPDADQPVFRLEANFVRVDAYPTRDGRPVTGLTAGDFELLEDGVAQQIATFEHVMVTPAGSQEVRVEPNTVRDSRAMAEDPRARVFVVFLDTHHMDLSGSYHIREPLIRVLDQVIGRDDLVGVMTPYMSAGDLALARRTTAIEDFLARHWTWGERHTLPQDTRELMYEACYREEIAAEMIDRRREKRSLDALEDLVRHLRGVREERKAILVVTSGWRLFRENRQLAAPIHERVPGSPEIYTRGGRLATRDEGDPAFASRYECDRDRMLLAFLDNHQQFYGLVGEANRANATFYPVDSRGLVASDTPLGPRRPLSMDVDRAILRMRQENLRSLAAGTDGMAVMDTNDLHQGLTRIVDDLTSYYLLGYYSTNTKLDGAFRSIRVRVRQPGVDVRARRGYRAATEEEVLTARAQTDAHGRTEPSLVEQSLAALAGIRPQAAFRTRAVAVRGDESGSATSHPLVITVVGELDHATARTDLWKSGAEAEITVRSSRGDTLATARESLPAGTRHFVRDVALPLATDPDEPRVEIRLRPREGQGLPLADITRVRVPAPVAEAAPAGAGEPLILRRGPATGPAYQPTADLRFRRNERIRMEVPIWGDLEASDPQLFDRGGSAREIPVTLTRPDGESLALRWVVVEAALSPLAPGDYVLALELSNGAGRQQVATAFRVVP